MENYVRWPSQDQVLREEYSCSDIEELAREGKVVGECNGFLHVKNSYECPFFHVEERIAVDKKSGRTAFAEKEFRLSSGLNPGDIRISNIVEYSEKASRGTNYAFSMFPSKQGILRFRVRGNDREAIRPACDIDGIVYLSSPFQ